MKNIIIIGGNKGVGLRTSKIMRMLFQKDIDVATCFQKKNQKF